MSNYFNFFLVYDEENIMQLHCDNSLGKRNVLSGIHVHVYVYLVFSIFVNSAEFIN